MTVNRICHGDAVDICAMAAGDAWRASLPRVASSYGRVWNTAQSTIATRVLVVTFDPDEIRLLQHDVLVPLDLRLVTRSQDEPLTFDQVTAAAVEALDHHHLDR